MTKISSVATTPVLVVGSGVAGLTTALNAKECTIVTAGALGQAGSTLWSQGGIAAAVGDDDSPESHADDTIKVSDGLTSQEIVERITGRGPVVIDWLQKLGAEFDSEGGELTLGQEAGHSNRRIVKSNGDSIGKLLASVLTSAVKSSEQIEVLENTQVVSLAVDSATETVVGALVRPTDSADQLHLILGSEVVLATGGYSYLWEKTTNPEGSIGAGLYLAGSVGAELADLEFVQFHPTALNVDKDGRLPLLTEAIRGEGSHLINSEGDRFMVESHTDAELAPRDVVARAIYTELIEGRNPQLDSTENLGPEFAAHFPGVNQIAVEHGFDPAVEALPVTPAAHYCMGGVVADQLGRTSVKGLRAVGEVARTGLHGANRLASNSLLEGLVMGRAIGQDVQEVGVPLQVPDSVRIAEPSKGVSTENLEEELRAEMWRNVGLVRNEVGLKDACSNLEALALKGESQRLKVMAYVSKLVAEQAWKRKESRGAHYRSDQVSEQEISSNITTSPIELKPVKVN